jgi:hypothetical protein
MTAERPPHGELSWSQNPPPKTVALRLAEGWMTFVELYASQLIDGGVIATQALPFQLVLPGQAAVRPAVALLALPQGLLTVAVQFVLPGVLAGSEPEPPAPGASV